MNRNLGKVYATIAGLSLATLVGCKEVRHTASDILHEDARVAETVYTPSRHGSGSGVGPTFDPVSGNVGVGITSVSVRIPEKYAVVFQCDHGKFISEGTDQRHKALWEKLSEGQAVDVTYREQYREEWDDIDRDGEKDLVSRTLIDYDFLDAQPK